VTSFFGTPARTFRTRSLDMADLIIRTNTIFIIDLTILY
jgi:hypothetical protein